MVAQESKDAVELGEEIVRRLKTMGEPEENADSKGWIIDTFLDHTEDGPSDRVELMESDFEELVLLAALGLKYREEHRDDRYDGLG